MEFGMRFVASYQWERIKLAGIIEYLDNIGGVDGSDRASGGFGATYAINAKNTFKAQLRHTNGVDKDASTTYALGLDHSIRKNTKIYAAYAITTNDTLAENLRFARFASFSICFSMLFGPPILSTPHFQYVFQCFFGSPIL